MFMLWRIPYICSSELKVMIYNALCIYTYYSNKPTFGAYILKWSWVISTFHLSVSHAKDDMFNISYLYTMSYESLKLDIDAILLFPLCLQYTSHILLMINACMYIPHISYCGACVTVQSVHYWNSITNIHVF